MVQNPATLVTPAASMAGVRVAYDRQSASHPHVVLGSDNNGR